MTVADCPLTGTLRWYRGNIWQVTGYLRAAGSTLYILIQRRDGRGEGQIQADQWDELTQPVSAWDALLPEYRSLVPGWSTRGEFYCPHCGTSIGKNLLGQKPIALALGHLRTHKEAS